MNDYFVYLFLCIVDMFFFLFTLQHRLVAVDEVHISAFTSPRRNHIADVSKPLYMKTAYIYQMVYYRVNLLMAHHSRDEWPQVAALLCRCIIICIYISADFISRTDSGHGVLYDVHMWMHHVHCIGWTNLLATVIIWQVHIKYILVCWWFDRSLFKVGRHNRMCPPCQFVSVLLATCAQWQDLANEMWGISPSSHYYYYWQKNGWWNRVNVTQC